MRFTPFQFIPKRLRKPHGAPNAPICHSAKSACAIVAKLPRRDGAARLFVKTALAVLILLLTTITHAQDSQFYFDPNGNLLVQTGATTAPPQIIGQPQNRMVTPGDSASFFVVAQDTRLLTYQWRFNGADISSATNDAVLLPNAGPTNEGEYRVVLTNPSGSVTSAPALLIIDSDSDGLGDSWEMANFGSLINSASTDADGDGSSNHQEYLDDTDPTNASSVLRHLTIVRDGGSVTLNPQPPTLNSFAYTNGQTVTLTAVSIPGEEPFHAWLGDVVTRSNSITLVMTNNKTLHARFTPITFTWTNLSGGNWNVAANWSPSLGVGSNDSVVISGTVTVTLDTPAHCADIMLGSAGNFPTLTGSGTLAVHRNFGWVSGNMTGSGRTIISPGATLSVFNPNVVGITARTLENGGAAIWAGAGVLSLNLGAVITNRAGALFNLQSSPTILGPIGSSRIDNAGTFRKSVSSGTVQIQAGASFNNSGAVEIQTGTLDLNGGGTHSGSFDVSAGTALRISGGNHTAGASSSITGAGQLIVSGGTVNLAGSVNVGGNHTFSGGIANFTGNINCTNNTLTVSGGTANFSSSGLVSPSVLNLSGGALDGTSTITVNNLMNWTGGNHSGSGSGRTIIAAGATLNLANPGVVALNARTLENGGLVLWTGGQLNMIFGAVITNRAGALFHAQNAAAVSVTLGAPARIDNAGTFRKSAHSGRLTLEGGVSFNNSGTVDIHTGILAANGGYTSTASALLNCVLGGTTPGVGYGQLQVAGNVTLAGNLSITLTNNFIPPANSLYTVLSAGSRSGTFANFFYPSNTMNLVVSNTPNSVVVRAVGPYFATTTLPDAMRNVGYTQQVTAVMSNGPVAYSVISGALPDGLSFSSGGLISGTPTNFGNGLFTIQALDAAGVTIQQAFNLKVRNVPPEGLISWWRAENDALDSISTNHGILTNGATFAAGNVGQTFALDGVNDYVHVPDSSSLRPASVTLEAWAMFNSLNGPVFCKPFGPATGDSFALYLLSGTLHGFIHDTNANGVLVSSPSTLTTGQWHHVAFTFDDGTKEQALYVNGVRVATSQSNRSIGYDNKPVLLGQDINNGNFDFPLNGRIDEAAIYNRALSSNEIAAIFLAGSAGKPLNAPYFVTSAQLPDAAQMVGYTQQVSAVLGSSPITFSTPSGGLPSGLNLSSAGTIGGVPLVAGTNAFVLRATDSLGAFSDQMTTLRVIAPVPAPSGLISWWRGEANALDSAGTNHGTASNGVLYVQGKVGQAFGFDGVNDFVWVPDAPNLRPASITLEAWARFNGTLGPVIGRSFGAQVHNSYVIWQLNGNINGTIGDALGADVLGVPFAPVPGQWYHVAFTFDDSTKQQVLYVNGAVVAFNQTLRSIAYDNHPVLLGGDIDNGSVSFLLNGGVDEAAIYNRALTAGEIEAIYTAGIAGKQLLSAVPRPLLLTPELIGSDIKLTWMAVSNATYRLEFNPDLSPSNWTALPGDVIASTNTASKLDTLTPSNRLYRVRVLP